MNTLSDYWVEMMRVRKKIRAKCAKLNSLKEKAEKRLEALHKIRDELARYLERLSHKKKRHMGASRHAGKMMMYRRWQRSWKSFLADQEQKLKKLNEEEQRVNARLYKLHNQLEKNPQRRQKMKNLINHFENTVTEFHFSWNKPMEGKENLKMHHDAVLRIRKSLKRIKKLEKDELLIEGLKKFWDTQITQKKSPKTSKVKVGSHPKTHGTPVTDELQNLSPHLFKMHKEEKFGFRKKIKHSSMHTKKKGKKTTFADTIDIAGNMILSAESSIFSFTEKETLTHFKSTSKRRQHREPSAKRANITPSLSGKSTKSTPASQDQSLEIAKLTGERDPNMVDTFKQKLVNHSTSLMDLERANQVMEQAKANAQAALTPAAKKLPHGKRPSDQHRLSALRSQAKALAMPKARRWTFYKKFVDLTGGKHAGAGLFKLLEDRQDEKYQQLHRLLSEIIHLPSMLDALQDGTEVYETILNHYMWNNLLEVFNDLKGMVPKHVILRVLKEQYNSFIDQIVTQSIEEGAKTVVDDIKTPPAEPMELPNKLETGNDSFDAFIDHSLGLIELNPSSFRSSKTALDRQSLEDPASLERLLSEQLQRMSDRYSLDNLRKIYEAHSHLFAKMVSKWPGKKQQAQQKKKSKLKRKQASKQVKPRVSPTRLFDAPHRTCRQRKADEMCAECSCDEEEEDELVPRCERCGDPLPVLHATPEESVTQLSLDTIEACGKNQELIQCTRDICYQCGYVHHEQQPCPMIWPQAELEDSKRLRYLRLIKEFAHNKQRLLQPCPNRLSKLQLQQE